ncbi:laccase domain-containing protein, partial [Schaalia hyovaginalis]
MFTLSGARVRLIEAGPGTGPLRNNPAHHVGDELELVEARRLALARSLGRPIAWMNQTHSSRVAVLTSTPSGPRLKIDDETAPFDPADPLANIEADGLIVDARAWAQAPAAAVMTADCLPVLLAG